MKDGARRRLAEGVAVRWTPALAARVRRRVDDVLARRQRRRHIVVLALGLAALGGVSYAFSRGFLGVRAARQVGQPALPSQGPASPPPPLSTLPTPSSAPPVPTSSTPVRPPIARIERRESPAPPRASARAETVESLFAAADAARLERRFHDAVAPLTTIFTRFSSDPRAAIAAFQLGRVYDDDLHDPASAGAAFARALALDPSGPLAADARTRARDTLERAGNTTP